MLFLGYSIKIKLLVSIFLKEFELNPFVVLENLAFQFLVFQYFAYPKERTQITNNQRLLKEDLIFQVKSFSSKGIEQHLFFCFCIFKIFFANFCTFVEKCVKYMTKRGHNKVNSFIKRNKAAISLFVFLNFHEHFCQFLYF